VLDLEPGVRADARSIQFTQRKPTDRTAVLFHGFTASPRQLTKITGHLFADGWNVIVPRLPLHGYEDRMTTAFGALDMPAFLACADTAVAHARTLGSRLLLGGFSLGGALALWAAHHHAAEHVVAIAPFFGLPFLPFPLQVPTAHFILRTKNHFFWWNPLLQEQCGPAHGYPRFATHPIARMMLFTPTFLNEIQTIEPRTTHVTLGLNARETSVHNGIAREIAAAWARHSCTTVRTHMIHGLPPSHDIIEPLRNGHLAERAFPQIKQLFEEQDLDTIVFSQERI
jgi:pimeloyl-ACP methyl ester carboxylesterase